MFTGFEKCFFQLFSDHISFCIGQMNIGCLLETKHFTSQWWIISQWVIPVNSVGFFHNLLGPSFASSCSSPPFSMSRLPSPCMWMKVQVTWLIFLIFFFLNWWSLGAVLKAGDASALVWPPWVVWEPSLKANTYPWKQSQATAGIKLWVVNEALIHCTAGCCCSDTKGWEITDKHRIFPCNQTLSDWP